MEIVSLFTSLQ